MNFEIGRGRATRVIPTEDRCQVIPADGAVSTSVEPRQARAILECMAQLARAARAPARDQRKTAPVRDSSMDRLDRAIDALEHSGGQSYAARLVSRITAARSRPVPDDPNAGPNPWQLMAGQVLSAGEMEARRTSGVDQAQICREAEAAYAARNPHKRRGAAT